MTNWKYGNNLLYIKKNSVSFKNLYIQLRSVGTNKVKYSC